MIVHQTQTLKNDCTLACIKMIADFYNISSVNVDLAMEIVHPGFSESQANYDGTSSKEAVMILHFLGIRVIEYFTPVMAENRLYLVTVPSLNITGGNHCLLIDVRDNCEFVIYDPALGRGSFEHYTKENFMSYTEVVEILGVK